MPEPKKILIVRLSAIGDVIHTLPCLHALRLAFPDAHIGWLVEELSASLIEGHPEIDELFVIPKKKWRSHPIKTWLNGDKRGFFSQLRGGDWDVAIDFQGLTKSGFPTWLSGARQRIGYGDHDGRELNKLFTNKRVTPATEAVHVIQRNLELLRPLGIDKPEVAWRFPDYQSEHEHLAPFLQSLGQHNDVGNFIAIYPGAGWESKRWPTEKFAQTARLLADAAQYPRAAGLPMVLVWGPGEETLCSEIIQAADLPKDKLLMAPATNLRQLAALLDRCALMLGGDTGPMHLAAALGKPVVGIYGASDPVRNGAWGQGHAVMLADDDAPCTICWKTRCNFQPFIDCLQRIEAKEVAIAVEKRLK